MLQLWKDWTLDKRLQEEKKDKDEDKGKKNGKAGEQMNVMEEVIAF
jgi:hypothetical protein